MHFSVVIVQCEMEIQWTSIFANSRGLDYYGCFLERAHFCEVLLQRLTVLSTMYPVCGKGLYYRIHGMKTFNTFTSETKIAEFTNSVDPDEGAHNEPPHLDLHCLPSSF